MTSLTKLLEHSRKLREAAISEGPYEIEEIAINKSVTIKVPAWSEDGVGYADFYCREDADFVAHALNSAQVKDEIIKVLSEALTCECIFGPCGGCRPMIALDWANALAAECLKK